MNPISTALSFLLFLLSYAGFSQASVLNEGAWYKLSVNQHGVYKIDRNLLRKMGIDEGKINPAKIRIFTGPSGLLPQANNADRLTDLKEIAIHVHGEADGKFDAGDYILFYAEGADKFEYSENRSIFSYERNYFTRENFYFLNIGNENGKRIIAGDNPTDPGQIIDSFDAFGFYKKDMFNILSSGRQWYGERFDQVTAHSINFEFPEIVPGSNIKLVSSVMAQSYASSVFKIFVNDIGVAEQTVLPISNFRYALKGRTENDTVTFLASTVNANSRSTQTIKLQYEKNNSGLSVGYLDYLLIQVKQSLKLYGNQTIFLSSESVNDNVSTYVIDNADVNVKVWDITDVFNISVQTTSLSNQQTRFSANSETLKSYIIFKNNSGLLVPEFIESIANQNIREYSTPNLLIVSHPDFLQEANRLAAHRQSHQIETTVVSTSQIFNEFSGGKPDATSIRDYVRFLWLKTPNKLENLLLFGKGSYDYLDILNRGLNLVPTYESRNSLHPLETYSSDDYFTFLEDHEGNWGEGPIENHTMDIGVGRIPIKNINEARAVVDKLIYYDQSDTFGPWRKEIVFVADDGDFNVHQSQANQMADNIELNYPEFNTQKIYLDDFQQIVRPSGQVSPETTKAITNKVEKGALIVNYTGHGGEQVWADERILDGFIISSWQNSRYPLFVTATCEFGRHDNPTEISAGELSLLLANKGVIGLVTTARPVSSSTNFELNTAFYDVVFSKPSGKTLSLGEVFRLTKNNSISGISNRNFSLLGDPSMRLAVPNESVMLTNVTTENDSDTIKALSKVNVEGNVVDVNSDTIKNFNGVLDVTVFDKPRNTSTLGSENPVFNFQKFDQAIFRGRASIVEGSFAFDFIAPKNIAYQTGEGKIALYASSNSLKTDASGANKDIIIGQSEVLVNADHTPPQISMYMGDASFIDGGFVPSNTFLVAHISDDSGINISSYGLGNIMSAQLNDQTPFQVNEYFVADLDDPTSGWLKYPIKNLSPGKHIITLRVWDVYNNPAAASIEFRVTNANEMIIEDFKSYPNPVRTGSSSSLEFLHSRAGQNLEAHLLILNTMGNEIGRHTFEITNSEYRVKLADFMPGDLNTEVQKLSAGIYLFKLSLRSLADGSKNEIGTKLIIIN